MLSINTNKHPIGAYVLNVYGSGVLSEITRRLNAIEKDG
jgi:hypothetical protein